MAITDPIGDLLSRIRNGQIRGKAKITSPNSRLRARLLDVLQSEGFIRGYAEVEFKDGLKQLEIELKYHEGRPVIRELKRVSTPGRAEGDHRGHESVAGRPFRGATQARGTAAQFVEGAHQASLRSVGSLEGLLPQGQAVAYRAS